MLAVPSLYRPKPAFRKTGPQSYINLLSARASLSQHRIHNKTFHFTVDLEKMELWRHPNVKSTRADAFRRYINRKYNLNLSTFAELHAWSVDDVGVFGQEMWIFCGMKCSAQPTQTGFGLDKMYPPPKWFPGARLNYTENLLCVGLASHANAVAVSSFREGGTGGRELTWIQLRDEVERWTSALKRAGVRKGDRVASTARIHSFDRTECTDAVQLFLRTRLSAS